METTIRTTGTLEQINYLFEIGALRSYKKLNGEKKRENEYQITVRHNSDIRPSCNMSLKSFKAWASKNLDIDTDQVIKPDIKIGSTAVMNFQDKDHFNMHFHGEPEVRKMYQEFLGCELKVEKVIEGSFKQLHGIHLSCEGQAIKTNSGKPYLFDPYFFLFDDYNLDELYKGY